MPRKIDPNEVYGSWDEIAGAMGVSDKTARRYERQGLRVRRLTTSGRAPKNKDRARVYCTGRMILEFIEGQDAGRKIETTPGVR